MPSGITTNDLSATNDGTWYDSSGNGLDGVATGATPTNHGLQSLTINSDGPDAASYLLAIKTADTTKFVVQENGRIGIRTDNPLSHLSIFNPSTSWQQTSNIRLATEAEDTYFCLLYTSDAADE